MAPQEMLAFASLADTTAPAVVSMVNPRKLQTLLLSVFKPGAAASQNFFFCTWLGSAACAYTRHDSHCVDKALKDSMPCRA